MYKQAIAAFAVLTMASQPALADDRDGDIDRERAICALYGEGLSVQIDKSKNTVTIDWDKSGLSPAVLQRFVETYYLPKIKHSPDHHDSAFIDTQFDGSASASKLGGIRGHKLLEPYTKMDLCKLIAKDMGTLKGREKMERYCGEQGVATVNHAVFAFRGKRVTYSTKKPYDGLRPDEVLFAGKEGSRDIAVTVMVPRALDTYRSLKAVWPVTVNAFERFDPKMASARARAGDVDRKAKALIKVKQAKALKNSERLAGRRGNIVFAGRAFTGFELIEPLAKNAKPSCSSTFVYAFGPRAGGKKGAYQVVFKANGKQCIANVEHGKFTRLYRADSICKQLKPGSNKIEVQIAKNVNKKLGTRWDKAKLRKVPYYSNTAGKAVVKKTVRCTVE